MPTLAELTVLDKTHWLVHLKALEIDMGKQPDITRYLGSKSQLPSLKHPSLIHNWWEADAKGKLVIEALDG